MPSAQVPLWVTYSLAVIAIIGPVGGAFLGAWFTSKRDDKRIKIEAGRELERRAHDDRKELRQQRIDLYAKYLAVHREWALKVASIRLRLVRDRDIDDFSRSSCQSAGAAVAETRAMIDLVGSDHVVATVSHAYGHLFPLYQLVMRHVSSIEESRAHREDVRAYDDGPPSAQSDNLKKILAAFREDLGARGTDVVSS